MSSILGRILSMNGIGEGEIEAVIGLQPGDIAYCSGSLFDGLGGVGSDVDIFVLTTRENFERRKSDFASERRVEQRLYDFGILYVSANEIIFDVEFHVLDKYENLFGALTCMAPITRDKMWENFRSLASLERCYALELLHRFRCGEPIGDRDAYSRLREKFPEDTFLRWGALYYLMECEDFVKGVSRSVKESDVQSAWLKLRHFYDSLVDASLFLGGESLDRWKWRLPKLRRIRDPELLGEYVRVHFGFSQDEFSLDLVTKLLSVGKNRLNALVEENGWTAAI